ncbi:uncharacterized protein LOC122665441 [Telopea speciosissima]|uniref:uncharacterized protein LOC122665441 n=1 Tax=Telopea speciosissima TaxID=54955 RepID=UPI001CC7A61C|nr:uncharacterized protein LOC122665441 [Telopea speciosissima]
MQRQSLGSPGLKLHSHGEAKKEKKFEEGEQKRKSGGGTAITVDERENQVKKPHRLMISRPEKSILLIPILTLFCLLVLYLCSYDPSQTDLGHFKDIRRSWKPTGKCSFIDEIIYPFSYSQGVSDFGRLLGLEKSEILAIRSHWSLQEIGKQAQKS